VSARSCAYVADVCHLVGNGTEVINDLRVHRFHSTAPRVVCRSLRLCGIKVVHGMDWSKRWRTKEQRLVGSSWTAWRTMRQLLGDHFIC
jgi:hypothetical protein